MAILLGDDSDRVFEYIKTYNCLIRSSAHTTLLRPNFLASYSMASAFDVLVEEFNETVGREKGIYVQSYSQGSVSDLETAVRDSINGTVGADEMPDIFSSFVFFS